MTKNISASLISPKVIQYFNLRNVKKVETFILRYLMSECTVSKKHQIWKTEWDGMKGTESRVGFDKRDINVKGYGIERAVGWDERDRNIKGDGIERAVGWDLRDRNVKGDGIDRTVLQDGMKETEMLKEMG